MKSVQINEIKTQNVAPTKRIAYLVDAQTIHILDLNLGANLGVITHDAKIDWLEVHLYISL